MILLEIREEKLGFKFYILVFYFFEFILFLDDDDCSLQKKKHLYEVGPFFEIPPRVFQTLGTALIGLICFGGNIHVIGILLRKQKSNRLGWIK